MKIIRQDEGSFTAISDDKTFKFMRKFDGCLHVWRYYNGRVADDDRKDEDDVDYVHICDKQEFIHMLREIEGEALKAGFEK